MIIKVPSFNLCPLNILSRENISNDHKWCPLVIRQVFSQLSTYIYIFNFILQRCPLTWDGPNNKKVLTLIKQVKVPTLNNKETSSHFIVDKMLYK